MLRERFGVARVLVAVACLSVTGVLAGVLIGRDASVGVGAPPARALARAEAGPEAVAVLRAWDEQRAAAYAEGDAGALRALYVARSPAGRVDTAVLRSYVARGLVVEGMRMQLLAVDVVRSGDARLVLDVTDRLASAVAVGEGLRVPLPRDRISTRRIVLVDVGDGWQVSRVRPRSGT